MNASLFVFFLLTIVLTVLIDLELMIPLVSSNLAANNNFIYQPDSQLATNNNFMYQPDSQLAANNDFIYQPDSQCFVLILTLSINLIANVLY